MRYLFLIITSFFFICCKSIDYEIEEDELYRLFLEYSKKSESVIEKESFMFFSDIHLLGSDDDFSPELCSYFEYQMLPAKSVYDWFPVDFCLCGGDLLNQRDSQEQAQKKLLYADEKLGNMFNPYFKMMGNHDTNYQGYLSPDNHTRGDLPRNFIDDEYFSSTKSAYYTFEGNNTVFYVLDSALDYHDEPNSYKWEQLHWLASELIKTEAKHIVIGIHLFFNEGEIVPMSREIVKICDAFNSKTIAKVEEEQYNYETRKGKVHLILSGHNHIDGVDYVGINNNIPVVRVSNYMKDNLHHYYLCLLNYDDGLLDITNVEKGSNRHIKVYN